MKKQDPEIEAQVRAAVKVIDGLREELAAAEDQRDRLLAALRKKGYSYAELGDLVNVTKGRAHQIVNARRGIRY